MKKIGCSKRKTWCEEEEEEGIIYCKNCGCMYDSKCHCIGVEFIYEETEEDKIKKALEIAWDYSQIDGAHHKAWAIDKMVRALCGTEEEYKNWVAKYEEPQSNEPDDYYTWDVGIAP